MHVWAVPHAVSVRKHPPENTAERGRLLLGAQQGLLQAEVGVVHDELVVVAGHARRGGRRERRRAHAIRGHGKEGKSRARWGILRGKVVASLFASNLMINHRSSSHASSSVENPAATSSAARFLVRPFNALRPFRRPERSDGPPALSSPDPNHASRHRRVIFAIAFRSGAGARGAPLGDGNGRRRLAGRRRRRVRRVRVLGSAVSWDRARLLRSSAQLRARGDRAHGRVPGEPEKLGDARARLRRGQRGANDFFLLRRSLADAEARQLALARAARDPAGRRVRRGSTTRTSSLGTPALELGRRRELFLVARRVVVVVLRVRASQEDVVVVLHHAREGLPRQTRIGRLTGGRLDRSLERRLDRGVVRHMTHRFHRFHRFSPRRVERLLAPRAEAADGEDAELFSPGARARTPPRSARSTRASRGTRRPCATDP